jgi:hypothetical protein
MLLLITALFGIFLEMVNKALERPPWRSMKVVKPGNRYSGIPKKIRKTAPIPLVGLLLGILFAWDQDVVGAKEDRVL